MLSKFATYLRLNEDGWGEASISPSVLPSNVHSCLQLSVRSFKRPSIGPAINRPSVLVSFRAPIHPYLSVSSYPSMRPSVRPFVHPCVRPYVRAFVRPCKRDSVRPFLRSSIHLVNTSCTAISYTCIINLHMQGPPCSGHSKN